MTGAILTDARARERSTRVPRRLASCRRAPTRIRRSWSGSATTSSERDWVMVGREEDVAEPGSFQSASTLDGENIIVVRGRDDVIRAFYNVCRHRGHRGRGARVRQGRPLPVPVPRLDLRPRRHGSSGPSTPRTSRTSASTPSACAPIHCRDLAGLRVPQPVRGRGRSRWRPSWATSCDQHRRGSTSRPLRVGEADRRTRSAANWKFIAENYSECYHCPGVHPQLNKLTPYDLGGDFDPNGAWQGGWMELVDGAETMALDGGHGSTPRPAADVRDHRRGRGRASTTTSCGR